MLELLYAHNLLRQTQTGKSSNTNDTNDPPPPITGAVLVVFLIFFILEIVLIVWSVKRAIKCTKNEDKTTKLIHFALAFFLPVFYLIYSYAIDDCK